MKLSNEKLTKGMKKLVKKYYKMGWKGTANNLEITLNEGLKKKNLEKQIKKVISKYRKVGWNSVANNIEDQFGWFLP